MKSTKIGEKAVRSRWSQFLWLVVFASFSISCGGSGENPQTALCQQNGELDAQCVESVRAAVKRWQETSEPDEVSVETLTLQTRRLEGSMVRTSDFNACVSSRNDDDAICVPTIRPVARRAATRALCLPIPTSLSDVVGLYSGSRVARDVMAVAEEETIEEGAQSVALKRFCDLMEDAEYEASREKYQDELGISDSELGDSSRRLIEEATQVSDELERLQLSDEQARAIQDSLASMSELDVPTVKALPCVPRARRFFIFCS